MTSEILEYLLPIVNSLPEIAKAEIRNNKELYFEAKPQITPKRIEEIATIFKKDLKKLFEKYTLKHTRKDALSRDYVKGTFSLEQNSNSQ